MEPRWCDRAFPGWLADPDCVWFRRTDRAIDCVDLHGDFGLLGLECASGELAAVEPLDVSHGCFAKRSQSVSPGGLATIIRAYQEDRLREWNATNGVVPETWFWPWWMAREIAEAIRHARAFAERFEAPETVSFRAEWHGLEGRILKDPNQPWAERGEGAAREDSRVVARTVPVAELAEGWPKLTAEMLSPVLRMFDPYRSVSAEQVQACSRNFRG